MEGRSQKLFCKKKTKKKQKCKKEKGNLFRGHMCWNVTVNIFYSVSL